MARLIHLNGPPGVGKTSLARRYLDDHPLALLLDIDGIRASLGRWQVTEQSKHAARKLAVTMAAAHLRDGSDVVVPQYVGRTDFIATLEEVARRCEASFVEVLLDAPAAVVVDRFRARRTELLGGQEHHPEADVPDGEVEAAVEDARTRLAEVAVERGDVIRIAAGVGLDALYASVLAALDARR